MTGILSAFRETMIENYCLTFRAVWQQYNKMKSPERLFNIDETIIIIQHRPLKSLSVNSATLSKMVIARAIATDNNRTTSTIQLLPLIKYMKYILDVRTASNLLVLSETGRYPIYFSLVMSMLKYFHRLENFTSCIYCIKISAF